jgi:hypothetical protein
MINTFAALESLCRSFLGIWSLSPDQSAAGRAEAAAATVIYLNPVQRIYTSKKLSAQHSVNTAMHTHIHTRHTTPTPSPTAD